MSATVASAIARAIEAMDRLAATAEAVDDEWQYVTDLRTVWVARLRAASAPRAAEPAPAGAEEAVRTLAEDAAAITDPHRAIDWLSTLPQAVLLALGETPS